MPHAIALYLLTDSPTDLLTSSPSPYNLCVPFSCPICKKNVDDSTIGEPGSLFPFCSDRCKLIDLGRWLNGSYQIPVKDQDADETGDESTLETWQNPNAPKRG